MPLLEAEELHDGEVLPRLGHHAVIRGDDQEDEVDACRSPPPCS
jgi:hypothetical protein